MELKGKNSIVTGGAKGIGRSIVEILIKEGANVGVFDIDQDAIDDLLKEFPDIYCGVCDVSNFEHVEFEVNKFYQQFDSIDILVNNASLIFNSPLISFGKDGLKKHDIEMWNKVVSTDLNSVFYMTANVVEKMISKRTKGIIVNVSSICAAGNAGQSAYSAAKAGVNALTNLWAKELSSFKIRVAGIAPGYTKTDTTMKSVNENILNSLVKQTPSKRLGEPYEIADGILFIIKNDFFNGKVLELDGGLKL